MRPKMKLFISRIAHTKPALGIWINGREV